MKNPAVQIEQRMKGFDLQYVTRIDGEIACGQLCLSQSTAFSRLFGSFSERNLAFFLQTISSKVQSYWKS